MNKYAQLIVGVSEVITDTLQALRNEEHFPQLNADQMDHKIKTLRAQVDELRVIRERLEEIATTPIHGGFQ